MMMFWSSSGTGLTFQLSKKTLEAIPFKLQICFNFPMLRIFLTLKADIALGTLMTSAAADVINHNGRKIGRFKPCRILIGKHA